ncbi:MULTISPECIES: hypothetical protein [unclassified Facklamia]|uniref:hypothetical protein n=1 Tax=Aerococcaceae TaxID=186827 RepID=UPI0013B9B601|nr:MULTISPECIES: hypothetical protein [unclassified Facklamia]NEW64247.1 hypothetical protein [Facklamia sp. 252]NEW68761.1 hypothetical protein [Facklamia sp. 253]QQD64714.1 hypothetical protein JDW14_05080 [Aerococcaceae bacterium zg-252]
MTMADFRNTKQVFYGGNEIGAVWYRGEKIWEKPEEDNGAWEELFNGTLSFAGSLVTRLPQNYSRFMIIDSNGERQDFDMQGTDDKTIEVGDSRYYVSRTSSGLVVDGGSGTTIVKGLPK